MKRAITLALSVLLLMGLLAGCGGDKALVGKWAMTVDMVDALNAGLNSAGLNDAMRLSAFVVTMNFTFKSDGTYVCQLNADAFQNTMDALKDEMKTGYAKYIEDKSAAQGTNMTIDEFLAMSGVTIDEALDQFISVDRLAGLADEWAAEGNYKTKGGKLFLSSSLDSQVDPQVYYTYTIDGDSMSFLSGVGTDEDELSDYFPIQLTRIS